MRESSSLPDIRPRPDPTVLTTAALKLAVDGLERFLISKIESVETLLTEKIQHNFLMDEKRHRETREWLTELRAHRLEVKHDRDKALELALSAQKELFLQARKCTEDESRKTEDSFSKQIEALSTVFRDGREALSDRIYALKEVIDRGEGKDLKVKEHHTTQAWVYPMIFLGLISTISLVIQIVRLVSHYP